jgi:hypothetical protein
MMSIAVEVAEACTYQNTNNIHKDGDGCAVSIAFMRLLYFSLTTDSTG